MYFEWQFMYVGLVWDYCVICFGQCVIFVLFGCFDLSWGLNWLVGYLVVDVFDFKGDIKIIDVWGCGVGQGQCY